MNMLNSKVVYTKRKLILGDLRAERRRRQERVMVSGTLRSSGYNGWP